jgi:hypothetical protein
VFARHAIALASAAVRIRHVRIEPDGLGAVGDGLVVLADLAIAIASVEVKIRHVRIEPNGRGVFGNRLVEIVFRIGFLSSFASVGGKRIVGFHIQHQSPRAAERR